jgi:hypothetical protein
MEESSIYRGKNLIGKNFLLRVVENPSCRNSSYVRNITWKRYEFFSGNINSLRVMENSSYRRSTVLVVHIAQSRGVKLIVHYGPLKKEVTVSAAITWVGKMITGYFY